MLAGGAVLLLLRDGGWEEVGHNMTMNKKRMEEC